MTVIQTDSLVYALKDNKNKAIFSLI